MIQKDKNKLLHLQFVDIEGALKQISVTANQIDDAINGKIMFDGSSILGFSPIEKSDLYLAPDTTTYTSIPWSDHYTEMTSSRK